MTNQVPMKKVLGVLLHERYGLEGSLEQLDGEFDLIFCLSCACGDFIVRVMRSGCDVHLVTMQCEAIRRIHQRFPEARVPEIRPTIEGADFATLADGAGERLVWVTTRLPGQLYARCRPRPAKLAGVIGRSLAEFHEALLDFHPPVLDRSLKWDLRHPEWIREHLDCVPDRRRRGLLEQILGDFERLRGLLLRQPMIALHNDINDYNILVSRASNGEAELRGLIDFGDMMAGPAVCELAIAGAYLVLDERSPFRVLGDLVRGYHHTRALSATQLELIFPLLLTRLAVSVVNAAVMKLERPGDAYVSVSEAPAWAFLERFGQTRLEWASVCLKNVCGVPELEVAAEILAWVQAHAGHFARVLGAATSVASYLDQSVGSGQGTPLSRLGPNTRTVPAGAIGRYGEARIASSEPSLLALRAGESGSTISLGIELFASAGELVHAPIEGILHAVDIQAGPTRREAQIILRHSTDRGQVFFTVYEHLSVESAAMAPGSPIARGAAIGRIASSEDNGGWATHVRCRLSLLDLGAGADWPAAADPEEAAAWKAIFANPARVLGLDSRVSDATAPNTAELLRSRQKLLGGNLRLSYSTPLVAARGWKHFVYDSSGRAHVDAYNNVPHVGHCHPRVVAALTRQANILNTNTRYLHPNLLEYARALCAKFPEPLRICYLVNSASEANELALRLARAVTGCRDTIVMDQCYHGNTNTAIDISAYKFNGPGGEGPADWVHVTSLPDTYRGPFRRDDRQAGDRYARQVEQVIAGLRQEGRGIGAFICESMPSVGGQIVLPQGYLAAVYRFVRAAGGCCIADEVQTGLGRIGTHFWAFESQEVVPDIVVLGKPLGNGHPLGAVITTQRIAEAFDNGMEFFSTFGGNTVSAAVGHEVLKIVQEENLQAHAAAMGTLLGERFRALADRYPLIGDVRGAGLFWGIELVSDPESLEPATDATRYVVNRLREERILAGTEGRFDNVLKVRPPMTFDAAAAEYLVDTLQGILSEDFIRSETRSR